jgi:hypothetical protein
VAVCCFSAGNTRGVRAHHWRLVSSRRLAKNPAVETPAWQRDRAAPFPHRSDAKGQSGLRRGRRSMLHREVRHECVPDPTGFVSQRIEPERRQRLRELLLAVQKQRHHSRVPGVEGEIPPASSQVTPGGNGRPSSIIAIPAGRSQQVLRSRLAQSDPQTSGVRRALLWARE